jgi:hypothetical protein
MALNIRFSPSVILRQTVAGASTATIAHLSGEAKSKTHQNGAGARLMPSSLALTWL